MKHILILIILLGTSGCTLFDTPRLPIPFSIFEANDTVNQTPYLTDKENYGQVDYWATPKEFYSNSRGDCEDYAIAKYFMLRKQGIPAYRLRLAVGRIDDGDSVHAVLLVIYKDVYVLDNIVQRVTPLKEYIDFDMMYTFNEQGVYFRDLIGKVSTAYLPKWHSVITRVERGE